MPRVTITVLNCFLSVSSAENMALAFCAMPPAAEPANAEMVVTAESTPPLWAAGRSDSDSVPTLRASAILLASSGVTSSVTEPTTLGVVWRSSAPWPTESTLASWTTTSVAIVEPAAPLALAATSSMSPASRVSTTSTRSPGVMKPPTPAISSVLIVTARMPGESRLESVPRPPGPDSLPTSTGSLVSIGDSTIALAVLQQRVDAGEAALGQRVLRPGHLAQFGAFELHAEAQRLGGHHDLFEFHLGSGRRRHRTGGGLVAGLRLRLMLDPDIGHDDRHGAEDGRDADHRDDSSSHAVPLWVENCASIARPGKYSRNPTNKTPAL